jgi:hypothetical protein
LEATEPFPTSAGQRWSLCSIQPNHVLSEYDAQFLLDTPGESEEEKEQARSEWIEKQQQREGYLREVCHSFADSVKLAFSKQKQPPEKSPRTDHQDEEEGPEEKQQESKESDLHIPEVAVVTRD